jgi:hypothetical protein
MANTTKFFRNRIDIDKMPDGRIVLNLPPPPGLKTCDTGVAPPFIVLAS